MKQMEKSKWILTEFMIIMGLVLISVQSCTKVQNDPKKTEVNMKDQDGNTYKVIVLGTQTWMAENLKTTTFNDNTPILNVIADTSWIKLATPGYCWYNNDENANKPVYGALYNWYSVTTGKLCSAGWHVPTDADFDTLELYLGLPPAELNVWGSRGTDQGAKMKTTEGWDANGNGTNTSGFSALPGGYRYAVDGSFNALGAISYWWTSTEDSPENSWYRRLDGGTSDIYRASTSKIAGKYVRCVKD
jgi:uncharacterized protein (TIGR02145 family)